MKNFQKIKYSVNTKDKIVTAVLKADDAKNEFGKIFDDWYYTIMSDKRLPKLFPEPFVAITHCNSKDTWDENIGKKVARKKLELQVYKAKKKYLSKELSACIDRMNMLNTELQYAVEEYTEACKQLKDLRNNKE